MRTPLRLLVVASCLALPGVALAQEDAELSPEKVAAIRRDEQQALSKVDAEYGNRKPSEMSQEERREAIQKQAAASASAMEKHGVSAKDYARYTARMTPEDNARAKAEEKRLEAQAAQAAQAAAAKKPAEEQEVHVQQGFSEQDPVELEAEEGAEPVVDVGVPGEGQAKAESVPVEGMGAAEEKPARRSSSGVVKKKKRSSR
jgi:hypothetical protein